MRIRIQFAAIFFFLLLLAGYAGLSSVQVDVYVNDKVLHFLTFLVLTVIFYWILDTNRRRTLNMALIVCTGILGVGSEFVQAVLPNARSFDVYDIVANVVGSLCGLGVCYWYHKRMLERKMHRRGYSGGGGGEEEGLVEDMDIELTAGGHVGEVPQEMGIADGPTMDMNRDNNATGSKTLEERVDEWDENDPDTWDDDDMEEADITSGSKAPEAARNKRLD